MHCIQRVQRIPLSWLHPKMYWRHRKSIVRTRFILQAREIPSWPLFVLFNLSLRRIPVFQFTTHRSLKYIKQISVIIGCGSWFQDVPKVWIKHSYSRSYRSLHEINFLINTYSIVISAPIGLFYRFCKFEWLVFCFFHLASLLIYLSAVRVACIVPFSYRLYLVKMKYLTTKCTNIISSLQR